MGLDHKAILATVATCPEIMVSLGFAELAFYLVAQVKGWAVPRLGLEMGSDLLVGIFLLCACPVEQNGTPYLMLRKPEVIVGIVVSTVCGADRDGESLFQIVLDQACQVPAIWTIACGSSQAGDHLRLGIHTGVHLEAIEELALRVLHTVVVGGLEATFASSAGIRIVGRLAVVLAVLVLARIDICFRVGAIDKLKRAKDNTGLLGIGDDVTE